MHPETKTAEGTTGDDYLFTSEHGYHVLKGGRGNDTLDLSGFGGGAYGGEGHDYFYGGGPGRQQSHMYGGVGNDTFELDTSDGSAPFGDHVWGGRGSDTFIFNYDPAHQAKITGRLDDFDLSRDKIIVNGTEVDFANLPPDVRIVQHNGQPWILIDERILFALEGARDMAGAEDPDLDGDKAAIQPGNANGEELHFISWPSSWGHIAPKSVDIPYLDFQAFFPEDDLVRPKAGFNIISGTDRADSLAGTALADSIWGGDGSDLLRGEAGDDVIDGGEGYDTIFGGFGNDSISGGLDNDLLYGGVGRDVIYGGSGQDTIYGGAHNDRLYGNNGRDLIYGDEGDDTLSGGWGSDTLYGGEGNDKLYAALNREDYAKGTALPYGENDFLYGGAGNDSLYAAENGWTVATGGEGSNVFYAAEAGRFTIKDFIPGFDTLDLTGLVSQNEDLLAAMDKPRPDYVSANDLVLSLSNGTTIILEGLAGADKLELLSSVVNTSQSEPDLRDFPQANWDEMSSEERQSGDDEPYKEDGDEEDEEADSTCFVATAAYGDPRHPDVVWLRYFRDETLVHYALGRRFIAFYWKVGPILARFVRADHASGKVARLCLRALVAGLRRLIR